MTFSTHYSRPKTIPQENKGEYTIDKALYQPTKERLMNYIRSGENLEDLRRLQYHSDMLEKAEDIETFTDPLLYQGYDTIDIQLMHKQAIEEILSRRNSGFSTAPSEGAEKNSSESAGDVVKPEVNATEKTEIAPNAEADK